MTIIVSQAQIDEINELLNQTDAAFLDLYHNEVSALREQLSERQVSTLTITEVLTAINVYRRTKRKSNDTVNEDLTEDEKLKKNEDIIYQLACLLSVLLIVAGQGQQNDNTNQIRR
ncbi:MAG: hypothetical protein IJ309_02015 [Clostridia bacterium]|nr:hypothetical protein [Clostridia bacterium]